jgi:hypothetical protein
METNTNNIKVTLTTTNPNDGWNDGCNFNRTRFAKIGNRTFEIRRNSPFWQVSELANGIVQFDAIVGFASNLQEARTMIANEIVNNPLPATSEEWYANWRAEILRIAKEVK